MSDIGLTAQQPVHRIGVGDDDAACRNGRQQRTHFAVPQQTSIHVGLRIDKWPLEGRE